MRRLLMLLLGTLSGVVNAAEQAPRLQCAQSPMPQVRRVDAGVEIAPGPVGADCIGGKVIGWEQSADGRSFNRLAGAESVLRLPSATVVRHFRSVIQIGRQQLPGPVVQVAPSGEATAGVTMRIGRDTRTMAAVKTESVVAQPAPTRVQQVVKQQGGGTPVAAVPIGRPVVESAAAPALQPTALPAHVKFVSSADRPHAGRDVCAPDLSLAVASTPPAGWPRKTGLTLDRGHDPRCLEQARTVSFEVARGAGEFVPLERASFARDQQQQERDGRVQAVFLLAEAGHYQFRARVQGGPGTVLVGPVSVEGQ